MICGPNDLSTVDQRAERHHLALRGCGLRAARCPRRRARNCWLGLHAHLVGAAELVEVVDVGRAEIRLQRAEDVAQRHVERLHLLAVDVDEELRHAGAEGRVERRQARSARLPSSTISLDDLLQLVAARRRRGPPPASRSRRATPRPRIAGGGKAKTIASWIAAEACRAACRGSRPGVRPCVAPFLPRLERDEERRRVRRGRCRRGARSRRS